MWRDTFISDKMVGAIRVRAVSAVSISDDCVKCTEVDKKLGDSSRLATLPELLSKLLSEPDQLEKFKGVSISVAYGGSVPQSNGIYAIDLIKEGHAVIDVSFTKIFSVEECSPTKVCVKDGETTA